jgi:hypothetical protein
VLRNDVTERSDPVETQLLSEASRVTAGVLLLALVTVAWGGSFVLRVARGEHAATPLQERFFRAGHAHAGVLVILALATQPYVDATDLTGVPAALARSGIGFAAIAMSAGFFLSVAGRDVERPNRLIWLIGLGAAALIAGLVSLGVGLLLT